MHPGLMLALARDLALLLAVATSVAAGDVPIISPSEASNHLGQEVIVEGLISDVGYSARSDTTFLNMGGKYPNHRLHSVVDRLAEARL